MNSYKKRPGISAFNAPGLSLADLDAYIEDLLQKAREIVPTSQYYDTPIYVMATAG